MIALRIVASIVALEHIYFMVLEMFLWRKPKGRAVFKMTQEYADSTAALAANQGLYNGFLAAGMIWAMLADPSGAKSIYAFFFGCVTLAGIYGGVTVSRRIAVLQAIPAALGLLLTFTIA